MTTRDEKNTAILLKAIEECNKTTGATMRDILENILGHYGIDTRLVEWHASIDGPSRCLFCGNTSRHDADCPWSVWYEYDIEVPK